MSGHTCPQCHEDFPSSSCALNGSIGHDCRPPEPIEPDDIRVGDTVRASSPPIAVTRIVGHAISDGSGKWYELHHDLTFELVSRPAPKPEVGQHWLNEHGDEYVVLESPTTGSPGFYPMRRTRPTYKPADAAPDGWTLKP